MDGRLGCININGHATSHVHISCQGQYGKNLDQRSNSKRKRECIAVQKLLKWQSCTAKKSGIVKVGLLISMVWQWVKEENVYTD